MIGSCLFHSLHIYQTLYKHAKCLVADLCLWSPPKWHISTNEGNHGTLAMTDHNTVRFCQFGLDSSTDRVPK